MTTIAAAHAAAKGVEAMIKSGNSYDVKPLQKYHREILESPIDG